MSSLFKEELMIAKNYTRQDKFTSSLAFTALPKDAAMFIVLVEL